MYCVVVEGDEMMEKLAASQGLALVGERGVD
jgi:hypothetical protein